MSHKSTDFSFAQNGRGNNEDTSFVDVSAILSQYHTHDLPCKNLANQIFVEADDYPDIFSHVHYLSKKCIQVVKYLDNALHEYSKDKFIYVFGLYLEVSNNLCSTILEFDMYYMYNMRYPEKPEDFPAIVSNSSMLLGVSNLLYCTEILLMYMIDCTTACDIDRLSYCASTLFAMNIQILLALNS